MSELTVSILIATKNGESSVRRLLASIANDAIVKRGEAEIIVLDDGSVPPVAALPVSKQMRNEQSTGVGAGRNKLAGIATGRYYLILDDDVELNDDTTISKALTLVQSCNDRCMVAFTELDPEGNRYWLQPSSAKSRSWIARFCGFAFLIPREIWNKCGGFSEILFYQYEEVDMSYRVLHHNYKIVYDPALGIKHYRKLDPTQKARIHGWLLRNMIFTTVLRFPLLLVPWNILRYVLLYTHFAAGDGRLTRVKKIVWSFMELARNLPQLLKQRQPLPLRTLMKFKGLQSNPETLADT